MSQDDEDAPWGTVDTHFAAIHAAARERSVEDVREQLERGTDVDELNGRAQNGDGGNTALWFAAQGPWPGGLAVARVLVDAGASIDRRCEHGRTALHMAAAWGHTDVARFLVDSGADVGICDDLGMTPVQVARRGYGRTRASVRAGVLAYLESAQEL